MTKRGYNNAGREAKQREVREHLIHHMVTMLAAGGEDISVRQLAQETGVSVRSIYDHFPDKEARIQAISQWIDANVHTAVYLPQQFDDIPRYIESSVDYILDNETVIRAQLAQGVSKELRSYRKLAHARQLHSALAEQIQDKQDASDLVAMIISLVRAEAVLDLRDIYKLPRKRIKQRLCWLFGLALRDLGGLDAMG